MEAAGGLSAGRLLKQLSVVRGDIAKLFVEFFESILVRLTVLELTKLFFERLLD